MFRAVFTKYSVLLVIAAFALGGCAVEAARPESNPKVVTDTTTQSPAAKKVENSKRTTGATIEYDQNGPADTVRAFYTALREKKFREALFLTNLRPAIEGLTDDELKDLSVDFEQIAIGVPENLEINGEIMSGKYATVTAKLPDNETREIKLQEIRLRNEGNYWVILTVDESAEAQIKKEGNRYLFNLRIQTHEAEAKAMLERIFKSQTVFALQNGGAFGQIEQLVSAGLLPEDVSTPESTGYVYKLVINGNKYYATAVPAEYGKTGKLSFLLDFDGKNPKFSSKDVQGQPLKK